jgi:hypothetical protein
LAVSLHEELKNIMKRPFKTDLKIVEQLKKCGRVGSRAPIRGPLPLLAAGIRYWISGFSETHVSRESPGVDRKAADLKVSALESSQFNRSC